MRFRESTHVAWVLGMVVWFCVAANCLASAELQFSRLGDELTITAVDTYTNEDCWLLVIDETKGVIREFYDLTSTAGTSWNFVSDYSYSSGLFAPFDMGVRHGSWAYTAGAIVDGQSSYVYTLGRTFGTNDTSYYLTTVTINAPTEDGTLFAATTECYYDEAAAIPQKTSPEIQLYAATEAQMNALYDGSCQDDLSIDGTLWSSAEVLDSTEAATLGLTPGRTFRVSALNLTDGTLGYDGANDPFWHDPFGVRFNAYGGIYDNYGSKPPAGALFDIYTQMDINIPCAVVPEVQLEFSRSGIYLTIDAVNSETSEGYWRMILDENRGVITSFYDLTSTAGTSWDFVSSYTVSSGLFSPFSSGIRNGSWDYTAGASVDGQDDYTYTLGYTFGTGDTSYYLTTVTIAAPTVAGTVISARTECYYDEAAITPQRGGPETQLYAYDETQMNALFSGSVQGDLSTDGTLWSEVALNDNASVTALGLTPGRSFRVTALNLTDGQLDYGSAALGYWSSPFGLRASAGGGIYDSYGSKPPAESLFNIYTRMDINIYSDDPVDNDPPVADAGSDAAEIDLDNDGYVDVDLDGSASYDNDGAVVAYAWSLGATPLGSGSNPTVTLPVGENTITLIVTDDYGASDTDQVVVTVSERTPRDFYVDQAHANASDANAGIDPAAPLESISAAMSLALSGDTITVYEGIYREYVSFQSSGTAEDPITLQAATGERVVVSGADELTSWTALPQALSRGNPNYANIYYADIAWEPARLDEDEGQLTIARSPNRGWWVIGQGTAGTTLSDPTNLAAAGVEDFTDGRVFFRNLQPVLNGTYAINAHDSVNGTLTLASALSDTATPDVDLYYVYNRLEMLDTAGEWVVEDLGGGTWRVYVWPSDSAAPSTHMYEATRRNSHLVGWGNNSYINIDGIEIRGGQLVNINDSFAIGSSGSGEYVEISNCIIHDNEYMGVHIRSGSNITVQNCLMFSNGYGVDISYASDILVKNNEIYANTIDGVLVSYGSEDIVIEGNYIHDHVLWGHPDNCQTYTYPDGVWYIDNVILDAGQGVMMQEITDVHFENNFIVASHANLFIIGHSNCDDVYLDGNTFAFSGYVIIANTDGTGRTFTNNIYYQGHGNSMMNVADDMDYTSDYNMFYLADGLAGTRLLQYNDAWHTWTSYQAATTQDSHSSYADPLFVNAPKIFDAMDAYDLPYYQANRVYLRRTGSGEHSVGDYVEMNFDGVVRTITAVDTDAYGGSYIEFTPAFSEIPIVAGVVANWKTNSNFTLDMTLQATSPAIGAGEGGRDIGCTLDMGDYMNCDFDGDGFRDVPAWPWP